MHVFLYNKRYTYNVPCGKLENDQDRSTDINENWPIVYGVDLITQIHTNNRVCTVLDLSS